MSQYDQLRDSALAVGIEKFVVGAFITDASGHLLMLQRTEGEHYGNFWELPSGGVEEGESWAEALAREVREETGLTVVKVGAFVNSLDYRSGSGRLTRQHNFVVEIATPVSAVQHSDEHQDFAWVVDAAQVLPLVTPDMQRCVDGFLTQKQAA